MPTVKGCDHELLEELAGTSASNSLRLAPPGH
jgi:hypothetical protein